MILILRCLPLHVENLIYRPNVLFWVSMTGEALSHVKGLVLPGDRHLIDPPMAACATHSLSDVNAMIEINVIRQAVDPVP